MFLIYFIIGFILPFVLFYISLILHELGHCLFPRLAGFKLFNVVYIGSGEVAYSFRILGMYFKFRKNIGGSGSFFTTYRFKNSEEFRQLMSTQTKAQIFLTHLGGNLMNLLLIIILWAIMIKMKLNIKDLFIINDGIVPFIIRWAVGVNLIMLLINLVPWDRQHDFEEFRGNDTAQLIRRLRLYGKQKKRGMEETL